MDDEIKGEGNSLNYEYRMHDPRIGRFFAIDPLASKYPEWSPYQFSGNRPIDYIESGGLEPIKPSQQVVFVLPQTPSGGPGGIEINPYELSWLSRKAFFNQVYDKSMNIGGPPRNIAMYTLLQFRPSAREDDGTKGPASLSGGSENPAEVPGQKVALESPRRHHTGYRRKMYAKSGRFNSRNISVNAPTAGSKAAGWAGLGIAIAELTYTTTETFSIMSSSDVIDEQGTQAEQAIYDVHFALQIGLIPEQYINPADIAVITNVLMTGDMTKSAQKYIFRSGDWQHLRHADFSNTINFAKNLPAEIANYEAVVSNRQFLKSLGMSEELQSTLRSIGKTGSNAPQ